MEGLSLTASHRGGSIGVYNIVRSYKNGPFEVVEANVHSHQVNPSDRAFALWKLHGDDHLDWYYDTQLVGYYAAVPPKPPGCPTCGRAY